MLRFAIFQHGQHKVLTLALLGTAVVSAAPTDTRGQNPATSPSILTARIDDAKWDVSNPPGEWRDIPIEARQGTWMNLDLSPDGSTIVFDFLGDVYTLPIDGGEAKEITSGLAWDMQPKWSPDGKHIAFTSDRAGGDNLWTIRADGSGASQISRENFRLVNSPAWTPDGEFIVGRKHFTSRRSLGAGELWLYHRTGSDGLQMTTRPNDQKDLGEPCFSPDGRYLYYSWDATPGGFFEYGKDSNGEIYIISRLDRVTGEIVPWITGPGGAVRPTPSRDGKSLAFVRRDRGETCLFIQDIRSGTIRRLRCGLERDMQETWAIHGVFPSFAWSRDNAALICWSGGKIWRIDANNGSATEIPFYIKTTRKVAGDALRFPIQVAPDTFEPKMLRWAEASPDGKSIVYQALGKLYIKDLPDGTPRRLTHDESHFEFCPAWSRDGASIVYTTWNDREMGTVRIVPSKGGSGRVLTDRPGVYTDPAISPDGTTVVFGKLSGGWLLGQAHRGETGVFSVPVQGGESVRVSKRGTNPQFGPDSNRVFLLVSEPDKDNDNTKLISVALDGVAEEHGTREHLKAANATEFRISPDGKWAAFVERFNVYITPLTATGRCIDVGPGSNAQPVARASADAGMNIRFSGDGTKLHWSLGPDFYTRPLTDCFAFLSGAPETLPEPTRAGLNISFTHPTAKPIGDVAFVRARILTMNGSMQIIEDGTVLVENNRITAVGKSADLRPRPGSVVVDCKGMVLMPGLIDVHAHGAQGRSEITPQRNWGQFANLAFGVTTIHDPSNDTSEIFAASELMKAGMIVAPRTFSTGTILYGAAGSFKAEINSLDDARFHLRRMKAVGAFTVKSYNQPRRDQRQQVLQAARELGMMVVPEGGALLQHNLTMVADGHTGVEHSLPCQHVYDDIVQFWGATRTGYTPTLVVGFGGIEGEKYWYQHTNVWENERLMRFVPRGIVDPRSRRRQLAPEEDYNHLRSAGIAKKLSDAGVTVQLGAHGQLAGLAAHWELWMFVQGGMSPLQALRCATLEGAVYLGLDKDLGSIEPGKLADIIVLEKDPTINIRNSDSVRFTMINGRLFDARTMDELFPNPTRCEPFHFTRLLGSIASTEAFSTCAGCSLPGCGQSRNAGDVPPERAYR